VVIVCTINCLNAISTEFESRVDVSSYNKLFELAKFAAFNAEIFLFSLSSLLVPRIIILLQVGFFFLTESSRKNRNVNDSSLVKSNISIKQCAFAKYELTKVKYCGSEDGSYISTVIFFTI